MVAYSGNVRYLKGPISEQISWMGISRSFFPSTETHPKLCQSKCWDTSYGEDHDVTINISNIDCMLALSCSMRKMKYYNCICFRVVAGLES